jgi:hypothetical protein
MNTFKTESPVFHEKKHLQVIARYSIPGYQLEGVFLFI